MRSFLPDFHVEKLLLDSAHDAMPYYQYCRRNGITPFIDLNEKRGIKEKYKDDFTIGEVLSITKALHLSADEGQQIFFAQNVAYDATAEE